MSRPLALLAIVCTGAPLAWVLVGPAADGLGGLLGPGDTLHVQVIDQESLGVVAGLAQLERRTHFGLGATTTDPTGGWVVVFPAGQEAPVGTTRLTVADDLAFTDPNGGTWLGREVTYEQGTAWVVPVGPTLHDDTLDADYNFALVVDWTKVGGDALSIVYRPSLVLH